MEDTARVLWAMVVRHRGQQQPRGGVLPVQALQEALPTHREYFGRVFGEDATTSEKAFVAQATKDPATFKTLAKSADLFLRSAQVLTTDVTDKMQSPRSLSTRSSFSEDRRVRLRRMKTAQRICDAADLRRGQTYAPQAILGRCPALGRLAALRERGGPGVWTREQVEKALVEDEALLGDVARDLDMNLEGLLILPWEVEAEAKARAGERKEGPAEMKHRAEDKPQFKDLGKLPAESKEPLPGDGSIDLNPSFLAKMAGVRRSTRTSDSSLRSEDEPCAII